MRTHQLAIGGIVSALLAAAAIAGCGGGGGGYSAVPKPTPTPTVGPSPSPTPVLTGNLNVAIGGAWPAPTEGAAVSAEVDFTCGCTNVAGTGTADASGNFNIQTNSTPVPTPNPNYTLVPGRNYMVIGTSSLGTAGKAQAWTMVFAGNTTPRNQFLNPGVNSTDALTAAVALYVFSKSTGGNSLAFDDWNFTTLQGFYTHLKNSPTTQETQLLSDIVAQQEAGKTIYPSAPLWRAGRTKNTTIETDLAAIVDGAAPTPCPTPGGGGPAVCTSPYPTP